jgi:predicted dienelactone hydrolase
MTSFTGGPPIEPPARPTGRRTTVVTDHRRDDRLLGIDMWYPAAASAHAKSIYELMPGLAFESAAALHEPPAAAGPFPLVIFSHGRTGVRFAYSMLCEALAARGTIVVSADHPGDALIDWLLGNNVDDLTNELNRVSDVNFVLERLLSGDRAFPADVVGAIDRTRIVAAGHSYGAYSALGAVAGTHGVDANDQFVAAVCLQPFTRTLSDGALGRVNAPTLLVVSEFDETTPAESDADRPWKLLGGAPTWRLDLAGATHQASSDLGLYAELAMHVPTLPAPVREYLDATTSHAANPDRRPWRGLLATQIETIWAFFQLALDIDPNQADTYRTRMSNAPTGNLRTRCAISIACTRQRRCR